MSFGIKLVSTSGRSLDSTNYAVNLVDLFTITGSSTGQKSYPALVGFKLQCVLAKSVTSSFNAVSNPVVSYSNEVPVVSWAPVKAGNSSTFFVYVFAV